MQSTGKTGSVPGLIWNNNQEIMKTWEKVFLVNKKICIYEGRRKLGRLEKDILRKKI